MGWILRTTVPSADSEALSALLWDLHPTGLAEIGSGDPRPTAPDSAPPGGGSAASAGAIPAPPTVEPTVELTVELLVGFDTEAGAEAAAEAVRGWTGRSGAAPLEATVAPADERQWLDPDRRVTIDVGGHRLDLLVGGAFGDGGHPSTRMALDLLAAVVQPGAAVLDVGTGTGVLALAARALGAGPVVAVDTDDEARRVAGVNVTGARRLTRSVPIEITDQLPPAPGSPTPNPTPGRRRLWEYGGGELPPRRRFTVVVANLVLGEQRQLAPLIGPLVAPRGTLVVAGLLTTQEDDVVALHPGFTVADRRVSGDWLALALRRGPVAPDAS